MKDRFRTIAEAIVTALKENAPTLLFASGVIVLCASIAHWSPAAAGVVAGVTLMVIGGLPAYLTLFRGMTRARKDS